MRTFIAMDLDQDIRERLAEVQNRFDAPQQRINWVHADQLHVTLKFLGEAPHEDINKVCTLVAEASARVPAFDFEVRGVAAVPPRAGALRMLWAGVADETGLLSVLHDELDKALSGLNFRQDQRGFVPHITLARIKLVSRPGLVRATAGELAETSFGIQHAAHAVVYASHLTPAGPIYAPLARAPLG